MRIQESRAFFYNSATEEKFVNSRLRENSENLNFAKIQTCEIYQIYGMPVSYVTNGTQHANIILLNHFQVC